jgi:hypothetical protein
MKNYKDIAKKMLNESMLYQDGITERMHPELEEQLRDGKHSLGECGVFPDEDVITSEMKLIRERFKDVVYACREAFDVDAVDNESLMTEQMPLIKDAMKMEGSNKKALEELAIKMVTEEFDIPEGSIEFDIQLRPKLSMKLDKKDSPELVDEEFEDHSEIQMANASVKKRRVLNAMGKGAASDLKDMFQSVHGELMEMNPRLPQTYNKLMAAGDYMYFAKPDTNEDTDVHAGMYECTFDESEDGESRAIIEAQGMVFPVLVQEMCKGVMELLSMHGSPTDERIAEYVSANADFTKAEPWDMRLGPAIWSRFCEMIPESESNLKHYVYTEVASLPPDEFNKIMREVLAKTKKGKSMISDIVHDVKNELEDDEFNESMGDEYFDAQDLLK